MSTLSTRIAAAFFIVVAGDVGLVFLAQEGCTKQQGTAVVNGIPTDVACAVDIATLIVTGNEDPIQVAKDCGMTLEQLILLLDQKTLVVDGAAPPAKFMTVRNAAVAILASRAKGK